MFLTNKDFWIWIFTKQIYHTAFPEYFYWYVIIKSRVKHPKKSGRIAPTVFFISSRNTLTKDVMSSHFWRDHIQSTLSLCWCFQASKQRICRFLFSLNRGCGRKFTKYVLNMKSNGTWGSRVFWANTRLSHHFFCNCILKFFL